MTRDQNKAREGYYARVILLAVVISVALITILTIVWLLLWSRAVTDGEAPAAEGDGAAGPALEGRRED
jgi:hypothetical protein